jgi:hypothetical protein
VGLILNTLSRSFNELRYQIFAFEKRLDVSVDARGEESA